MAIREDKEAKWYVIHTYSGYENKVLSDIEKMVKSRNKENEILELRIPTEVVTEIVDGKEKVHERKLFPSYVYVKMALNEDNWFLIRNIHGVTAFVGPGSTPVALTEEEVERVFSPKRSVETKTEVGSIVEIIDGPLKGFSGTVTELDLMNKLVKISISINGKEIPAECELEQVSPVQD